MIESPLLNSKTSNVNLSKWEQLNGLKLFVSHLNWVIHFHLRYIFICDTFSFVIQFIKLQFTIVNFLQSVEGGTLYGSLVCVKYDSYRLCSYLYQYTLFRLQPFQQYSESVAKCLKFFQTNVCSSPYCGFNV